MLHHGWATIELDAAVLTVEERDAVLHWEDVFRLAFNLEVADKEAAGKYRTENGVTVGYRLDSEREFFESRMLSTGVPEPNFNSLPAYATTVQHVFSALNKVAIPALHSIASYMGIDPQFFLDLTDMECNGVLPPVIVKDKNTGEGDTKPDLSSSLLRICKYGGGSDSTDGDADGDGKSAMWFGAHTDSSFFTVALCSSTPGLDIVDQASNSWVCPELLRYQSAQKGTLCGESIDVDGINLPNEPDACSSSASTAIPQSASTTFVMLFVGEFLQVLSKHRFKAAVHRVRNFGCSAYIDATANVGVGAVVDGMDCAAQKQRASSNVRISCPYLIRGRHGAVIDLHNSERYQHPGGAEAVDEDHMPNLDGTSVRMLHKLMDLKRQKCFRDNGSAEGANWVLSAYPVPPLPPDN